MMISRNFAEEKSKPVRRLIGNKNHFFLTILLICFFLQGNNPTDQSEIVDNSIHQHKAVKALPNSLLAAFPHYQNHQPIFIKGNANFSATAAVEGWNGNGNAADPYIIEGLSITSSSNETLIRIQNTDSNAAIYGMYFYESHNNTMINNTVKQNMDGIFLFASDNNTLVDNSIIDNSHWGIHTFRIGWHTRPLTPNYGSFNTLIGNFISNNGDDGLFLDHSWFNVVKRNTITNNGRNGISTYLSGDSILANNTVFKNGNHGIQVEYGENDTINSNAIANSTGYGVRFLGEGLNNKVEWNDFLGNNPSEPRQAWDDFNFDNTYAHNYWADWTEPDENSDGIVDRPYSIEKRTRTAGIEFNEDPTPLVAPYHLTSITITPLNGRERLPDLLPIQWTAVTDSLDHSIAYGVYYSVDDGKSWVSIVSDLSTTNYDWTTTTAIDGSNYRIKVVATCSEGFTAKATSDPILKSQSEASAPGILMIVVITLLILSLLIQRRPEVINNGNL
ncbi:MAG: right-handed parallel beta-helix repeat-containing protein [Candidatus Hodarchaeales archaeon]|jgi:parallel beta-helix repeat protein